MHDFFSITEHIGQQSRYMRMRIDEVTDTFNQRRKFFHEYSAK